MSKVTFGEKSGLPDAVGKLPIVWIRHHKTIERTPAETVAKYADFFVPDVSDHVGRMYTMDDTIRSLYEPAPSFLGTAVTLKVPAGDNLGLKMGLEEVQSGDVLVIDAQGFTDWCVGGFHSLVRPIQQKGLRALLVNGAYRDVSQAQQWKFPIYAKAIAAWSGPKRGPAEVNVPVCCGGVIVHPGDIVMGDAEGIVVVPRQYAEVVAERVALKPGKEHPDEMDHKKLVASEDRRKNQFNDIIRERGGILVD